MPVTEQEMAKHLEPEYSGTVLDYKLRYMGVGHPEHEGLGEFPCWSIELYSEGERTGIDGLVWYERGKWRIQSVVSKNEFDDFLSALLATFTIVLQYSQIDQVGE